MRREARRAYWREVQGLARRSALEWVGGWKSLGFFQACSVLAVLAVNYLFGWEEAAVEAVVSLIPSIVFVVLIIYGVVSAPRRIHEDMLSRVATIEADRDAALRRFVAPEAADPVSPAEARKSAAMVFLGRAANEARKVAAAPQARGGDAFAAMKIAEEVWGSALYGVLESVLNPGVASQFTRAKGHHEAPDRIIQGEGLFIETVVERIGDGSWPVQRDLPVPPWLNRAFLDAVGNTERRLQAARSVVEQCQQIEGVKEEVSTLVNGLYFATRMLGDDSLSPAIGKAFRTDEYDRESDKQALLNAIDSRLAWIDSHRLKLRAYELGVAP